MKSLLKKLAASVLLVPAIALGVSAVAPIAEPVAAFDGSITDGVEAAKGDDQPVGLFEPGGIFRTVTNILLFIIGAIAVIMLIIGGIRYVVSGGDQSAVTGAKNTILYAIVGIIVAILAYAAVEFVTTNLVAQ